MVLIVMVFINLDICVLNNYVGIFGVVFFKLMNMIIYSFVIYGICFFVIEW